MLPYMPRDLPPGHRPQPSPALKQLRIIAWSLYRLPQQLLRLMKRQYRLRTLLVFVAMIAVGAAWLSHYRSLLEKQDSIATELRQRGCIVHPDDSELREMYRESSFWRRMLGLESTTSIQCILIPRACDARDFELVRQVVELEEIYFKHEDDASKLVPGYSFRGWKLGKLMCIDPPIDCRFVLNRWAY